MYNKKLAAHQISLFAWERDEIAAVNRWRAEQEAAYDAMLTKLRALGLEDAQIYQDTLDKKRAMEQKYADDVAKIEETLQKKVEQYWNQFTNVVNQNINKMIQEHQSFAKTVENIWNQMVLMVIQYMEHLVEQWILTNVIMKAVSAIFGGSGSDTQEQIQQNRDLAMSYSGVAADEALMEYMPDGIAAAIAAATATYAVGSSFANGGLSLEVGTGFVPRTGAAFLHEGEAVVPAPTMKDFRSLVNNSSSTTSSRAARVNYSPTVNLHGGSKAEFMGMLDAHKSDLATMVNKMIKSGAIKMPTGA
jgi:hypothetical protein